MVAKASSIGIDWDCQTGYARCPPRARKIDGVEEHSQRQLYVDLTERGEESV
jgi:hypothetical protein